MSQQAQDDYYHDERALAFAYADAVNEEIRDLFAAGADVVQLDEPYLQARAAKARSYGVETIDRALRGVEGTTALHICFGYAAIIHERESRYSFLEELESSSVDQISIEATQPRLDLSTLERLRTKTVILGVLDLGDSAVETAAHVADRIRAAIRHVPPDRLIVAPDCGMKYLPIATARGKLRAMVEGARLVRFELRGAT